MLGISEGSVQVSLQGAAGPRLQGEGCRRYAAPLASEHAVSAWLAPKGRSTLGLSRMRRASGRGALAFGGVPGVEHAVWRDSEGCSTLRLSPRAGVVRA